MAIGDLVANVTVDTTGWSRGLSDAQNDLSSLEKSSQRSFEDIAKQSDSLGKSASLAATALSAVGYAAMAVGGGATGIFGLAAAVGGVGVAAKSTGTLLHGIPAEASSYQRLSSAVGKVGAAATLMSVGLSAASFVMKRFGKDTTTIDGFAKAARRAALAALSVRIALGAAHLSARAFSAAVTLPIKLATGIWHGFAAAVSKAGAALRSAGSGGMPALPGMGGVGMGAAAGALGAVAGLAGAAGVAVKLAADLEQTKIAFEVMTGSAEKADTMLAQMRKFSSTTPLNTKGVQDAGKTLLQFGIDGGQVMPVLRMLGDVSGGNNEKLQSLALVFGQMSAAGRLMGQDLLQFINVGFNPLQEISKHTGESMVSLKKKMEDGGISSDMVAASFQRATSQGGQFFGMLDRQGKSTSGLFGQLLDGIQLAMADIGTALIEGFNLNSMLNEAGNFLDYFRSAWLPGITTTINTVGQAFQRVLAFMRTGWGDWMATTLEQLVDFGANFDIYFQLAQQNIVLFVANGINSFDNFFNNIKQWMGWLGTAWMSLMQGLVTSVVDMAIKATGTLTSIATGAASGGITGAASAAVTEFGKSAVTSSAFDPFAASLADLPKLTTAAIAETSPELEALYQQLADRQAAAASKTVTQAAVVPAEEALKLTGKAPQKKSEERAALSIATKGSQEASKAINLALRGEKEKAAEQTAENTERTAEEVAAHTSILNDIRDNSRGSMTPVVVSFA